MVQKMKEIEFEEALTELETIVSQLEKGELRLNESLKVFQRGIELTSICTAKLEGAERKIDLLMKQKDETIKFKEFEFEGEKYD